MRAGMVAVVAASAGLAAGCGDGGGARLAAGRAVAADFKLACAGATVAAERRWPELGRLEPSLAAPALASAGPPADVHCLAYRRNGAPVVFRVLVRCGADEPGCRSVDRLLQVGDRGG